MNLSHCPKLGRVVVEVDWCRAPGVGSPLGAAFPGARLPRLRRPMMPKLLLGATIIDEDMRKRPSVQLRADDDDEKIGSCKLFIRMRRSRARLYFL